MWLIDEEFCEAKISEDAATMLVNTETNANRPLSMRVTMQALLRVYLHGNIPTVNIGSQKLPMPQTARVRSGHRYSC